MLMSMPPWANNAQIRLESFAGTVSSKGNWEKPRYGWSIENCRNCKFQWIHPTKNELWHEDILLGGENKMKDVQELESLGYTRINPKRCKKHMNQQRRWSRGSKVFSRLEEIRMNEEGEANKNLKFLTITREEWNTWHKHMSNEKLVALKKEIKKKGLKKFSNFRKRNNYWQSRNAMGQGYPECNVSGEGKIINGSLVMGYRLHFHIHMILVSKKIDNVPVPQPIGCGDSKWYREWDGISWINAVKDHQVKRQEKGETKYGCSRRSVMRYLTKYMTKAEGYNSFKIGKW